MNQRTSGHNWEREVVKELATLLDLTPDEIGTTRLNSRKMDNDGIDIWFKKPIGVDFQCKEKTTRSKEMIPLDASYIDYMKSDQEKAILFKTYRNSETSKRRKVTGKYAVIEFEWFKELLMLWLMNNNSEPING